MLVRGFPLRGFVAQVFGNSGDVLEGPPDARPPVGPRGEPGELVVVHRPAAAAGGRRCALAMRARKTGAVAIGFCGDGATSQGDFHAAMNFAGVWKAPCVHRLPEQPLVDQRPHRQADSVAHARGQGARVRDARACASTATTCSPMHGRARDAIARARAGGGPTFIEAVTYRMGAHSTSDDPTRYRSQAEVDAWAKKDPLERLRRHLVRLRRARDRRQRRGARRGAHGRDRGGDRRRSRRCRRPIAGRSSRTSTPSCPGTCASRWRAVAETPATQRLRHG